MEWIIIGGVIVALVFVVLASALRLAGQINDADIHEPWNVSGGRSDE
jgi:hypothetical protein